MNLSAKAICPADLRAPWGQTYLAWFTGSLLDLDLVFALVTCLSYICYSYRSVRFREMTEEPAAASTLRRNRSCFSVHQDK